MWLRFQNNHGRRLCVSVVTISVAAGLLDQFRAAGARTKSESASHEPGDDTLQDLRSVKARRARQANDE